MNHEEAQLAKVTVQLIDAGSRILAKRVLTLLALLGATGIFIAALCLGTWISLVCAGAFTLLVFLPALLTEGRGE